MTNRLAKAMRRGSSMRIGLIKRSSSGVSIWRPGIVRNKTSWLLVV
jgi:hypothetical protein